MGDDSTLGQVLTGICLLLVAVGALPIVTTAVQFLLIPLHAVRNHYRRAAPFLPNVAVVIPAWNEGAVIGHSIDRLLALAYPSDALRIYVVDDASTDDTPDVVRAKIGEYPGRVFHLRRETGGQGKAHTLNHGIAVVLADDWMEALLIMDADVVYEPTALRRMTRHLADPEVGAVTAYIREGSRPRNYLNRFVALEYALAQAASRRAQNVLGAVACLAGGAQLHSRENLVALGGRIDTGTLAEDTVTTFETQLHGRRVVFEPYAIVLAEEPRTVTGLWRQRLRWARGNVQITLRYRRMWLRRSPDHRLGGWFFAASWFAVGLLPVALVLSSIGLVGLDLLENPLSVTVFRAGWALAACTYLYTMILAQELDPRTARSTLVEMVFFPGLVSIAILVLTFAPRVTEQSFLRDHGLTVVAAEQGNLTMAVYLWMPLSMLAAYGIKVLDGHRWGRPFVPFLIYLVGYGPLLCAITAASYVQEIRHVEARWDKTEKTGLVT